MPRHSSATEKMTNHRISGLTFSIAHPLNIFENLGTWRHDHEELQAQPTPVPKKVNFKQCDE